ncbi:Crp/Fnr family transcriptional regulator [Flavisolibacter ginsenosidimutans]|uniref:Crp/Fnr family transcriptional regulator n=1 Tax=Flavisolibacter ginsenosidimutans TaxID=661481 RepID=A0A5B8UFR8_9BACT|nr:Crp/Fnr family transcriptional regulator [Flavisolibacter ginsenosidimutans]QEC55511.1 Crp/Fnr family transcriptional regulator [Flavisolibacter ginsenosidimutans]
MDSIAPFFAFLNKFIELEEDEFNQIIKPHIQLRRFRRKQIISQAGEVERYMNFIGEGLVRKYFGKEKEELITQISMEGHLIYSQESLNKQTPSHYCLQAIENTTLVSIEFSDLNSIFATNAKMERLGRLVATEITVLNERWQMMLMKMAPRERFLLFVERNHQLVQRVPQKLLASLLNIQPETFSRFKHLIKTSPGSHTEGETN